MALISAVAVPAIAATRSDAKQSRPVEPCGSVARARRRTAYPELACGGKRPVGRAVVRETMFDQYDADLTWRCSLLEWGRERDRRSQSPIDATSRAVMMEAYTQSGAG